MLGQTLSHYRVTARIGAGGMGEVYRATDTTLGRDVALKLLPRELASDPDRLARFEREAKLLASLNHPSIAQLYSFEQVPLPARSVPEAAGPAASDVAGAASAGGPASGALAGTSCVHLLVMELVEGLDLKQRLERGAIPVDEALEIALHVAEALEEAHGKGIVHRDLKPANVKLTADGKVKVLDFGLAKAWAGDGDGSGSSSSALSQSPTLAHTGTIAGVILGTAAYMSPEQARGKAVDKRADVWSFGVLLWEMLTGRQLFTGETVTDVIAQVMTREPDLDAMPPKTPASVNRLIARCLRRDPRQRLPDMGGARLDLQEAIANPDAGRFQSPGAEVDARQLKRWRRQRWFLAAVALLATVAAGSLALGRLPRKAEALPVGHFLIETPEGLKFANGGPSVSPDGRRIAFATTEETQGRTAIWVRALDSVDSRLLAGTEGGYLPFWSPDGESLGFFRDQALFVLGLASGEVRKLCPTMSGWAAGADWNDEGTILFSAGGYSAQLYAVSAAGGEPRTVTSLDPARSERAHFWPRFLPDGRHFLFQVVAVGESERGVFVGSVDSPSERKRLLPDLLRAACVAGQLVFSRQNTLYAQPFDAKRSQLTGQPHPIVAAVGSLRESGVDWAWFSASRSGVLVYTGQVGESGTELVWRDRQGKRIGVVHNRGTHRHIALSPDERQVAVEYLAPGEEQADVWTIDVARGIGTRQTSDKGWDFDPMWSPDGRELVFTSFREKKTRLYRRTLTGDRPEELFFKDLEDVWPEGWSADGKALIVQDGHSVLALPWAGDGAPRTLIKRSYAVDEPQVSPDGRWLAYIGQESGDWEVYIEPLGRPGERIHVSPHGGGQPKWRADGRELFYVAPDGQLMSVAVKLSGDRLEVALPEALFSGMNSDAVWDRYAVTRDGQRFLVVAPVAAANRAERIHVITNWTSLLEKR